MNATVNCQWQILFACAFFAPAPPPPLYLVIRHQKLHRAALSRRNAIEVRVTARGAESWVSAADKSAGFFRFLGQRLFQPPSPAHSTHTSRAADQRTWPPVSCSPQPSPAQPSSLSLVKRKVSTDFEWRGGGGSAPAPAQGSSHLSYHASFHSAAAVQASSG